MLRSTALLLAFVFSVATSAKAVDMGAWEDAVQRRCPARHLEWMCDGCYDDFLNDFEHTLPKTTQSRIRNIADYPHRCSYETVGFSCEMAVHVDAMHRLGLFRRFVAFGCAHYTCDTYGSCRNVSDRKAAH
jgi:hypothetical protein